MLILHGLLFLPLTSQNETALITIHYGHLALVENQERHPYAFGMWRTFDVYIEVVTELIKSRMWKRAAILYTDTDVQFVEISRNIEQ